MAGQKSSGEELFSKGLGVAIALGALAVGVAAAMMNNERSRQMREELRGRVDELGRKVEDLSAQADRMMQERRPEIEQTIQRSRRAAVEGLDKVRSVVEQGADKAQEYVQRAGTRASDIAQNAGEKMREGADRAGEAVDSAMQDTGAAAHDVMQSEGDAVEPNTGGAGATEAGSGNGMEQSTQQLDNPGDTPNRDI